MPDLLLDLLSNLLWAIIAATATWLLARRKIQRLRRQLRALQTQRGEREVVLIVSSREDIAESVRVHLEREGHQALPVFQLHHALNFSEQESDWMSFVHEAREEVKKIREYGASRVHFFTNAPVIVGVFTGALLNNGPEVLVYHYFNGVYRRVGSITHETVYY